MSINTKKVIYDPEGNAFEYDFLSAYDLLNHAGWTALPIKREALVTEADAVGDAEDADTFDDGSEEVTDNPEDVIPDFEAMTKDQLEDYAANNYGVAIDKRKSQSTIAADVAKLFEEHTFE